MTYKLTTLHQLMAYEFSQVEADFHSLTETQLNAVLTGGRKLQDLKDKLASGHQVLLKAVPSVPLLVQEKDDMGLQNWAINPAARQVIDPTAQRAFLNRAAQEFSSGSSGPSDSSSARQAPLFNPETDYLPEPPEPDRSQEPPPLKYEYNFEVACSEDSLRASIGCSFHLNGCREEPMHTSWLTEKKAHGTRWRILTARDNDKHLRVKVASASMGLSVPYPLYMRPIGSGVVTKAFLPLMLVVGCGGRAAFPTEGYFYHFHQHRLVQEYRILGDGKWSFYATRSTHDRLDTTQGFNRYQTAILVYWKLRGKVVSGQHLIYLAQPISRAQLDTVSESWLCDHGVALDIPIPSILAVWESTPSARPSDPAEPDNRSSVAAYHIVQLDPATGKREDWGDIAAQYDLSPKALLEFNPAYDRDPMSLAAGHTLTVRPYMPPKKVFVSGQPPQPLQTYNHPQNVWYPHSEHFLPGTRLKTLNERRLTFEDVVVVNLQDATPSKVFAKSCQLPQGCTDAGTTDSPLTDFGPWAFFFGQAHASPAVIPATPAAQAGTTLAASVAQQGQPEPDATPGLGLGKISGPLKTRLLDSYRLYAQGASALFMLQQSLTDTASQYGGEELLSLSSAQSRIRIQLTTPQDGARYPTVRAYHSDDARIPVRYVGLNEDKQYSVTMEDNGPILTWTPIHDDDPQWQTTPDQNDNFTPDNLVVTPVHDEKGIGIETLPAADSPDWRDAILVFPVDSGIPPLYVVFSKPSGDLKFVPAPRGNPPLPAFPDAVKAKRKTSIKGGGKLVVIIPFLIDTKSRRLRH